MARVQCAGKGREGVGQEGIPFMGPWATVKILSCGLEVLVFERPSFHPVLVAGQDTQKKNGRGRETWHPPPPLSSAQRKLSPLSAKYAHSQTWRRMANCVF